MRLVVFTGILTLAAAQGVAVGQSLQDGARVTMQGCLQRAELNGSLGGSIVGTSAGPNTAPIEANLQTPVDAYLLTEAVVSSGTASAPDRPAGTSGRTEMTTVGLTGREAELSRHQGARLEVVGTVVPPISSARGAGGAAIASGAKRLEVTSFKVLAERCVTR